jgi:peptidoglycan/xylan/chitin deacetylase (PgdA/CDA1 family)
MSDPTLHLAWTVDDGPTEHTAAMMEVFRTTVPGRPIAATWFVQWDRLEGRREYYAIYRGLQDSSGHEVGIHGASAVANHLHWFPTDNPLHQSFPTIQDALDGIAAFQKHLQKTGIAAKFVRAPTGLHSEVVAYLRKLKVTQTDARDQIARAVIDGSPLNVTDATRAAVAKVRADVETLRARLPQLGLRLWGGTPKPGLPAQSWEAESAGDGTRRRDTVNGAVRSVMGKLASGAGPRTRSLLILCHDTTAADLTEVRRDIQEIEALAKKSKVTTRYHTMSSLYRVVVGHAP